MFPFSPNFDAVAWFKPDEAPPAAEKNSSAPLSTSVTYFQEKFLDGNL